MRIPFEPINFSDLIHPAETDAEHNCQMDPLYDLLAGASASLTNRTDDRAESFMRLYPVERWTTPHVNRLYESVLRRLGCEERYPLYLKFDYEIQAQVTGSNADGCMITMSSTSVDELDDEELSALLGQAVGRIVASHAQNLHMIEFMQRGISNLPFVGTVAEKKLYGHFADWIIASQFTADRFALKACSSERAVTSLLLKQNGLKRANLNQILKQPVRRSKLTGIYFVWLAKSFPTFGAIERIQELRRWIRSEKFKANYPGFYYRLRLESGDLDDTRETILHQAASLGDAKAMVELVQMYLIGEGNLPRSLFMVAELSKAAAFLGNAQAMYLFALYLEKRGASAEILGRLYSAAASRGFTPALEKAQAKVNSSPVALIKELCADFADAYNNRTSCKVNISAEEIQRARDAFWMTCDEEIFALEIFFGEDGGLFGTAVTDSGIFIRLAEEDLPFVVTWSQFRNDAVYKQNQLLMCGNVKLCHAGDELRGTIAELIVRLAHRLRNA